MPIFGITHYSLATGCYKQNIAQCKYLKFLNKSKCQVLRTSEIQHFNDL